MLANWTQLLTFAFAFAAALLALRAAMVNVRDNMDEFMNDICRQSRWASWAAGGAALAAMLEPIAYFLARSPSIFP